MNDARRAKQSEWEADWRATIEKMRTAKKAGEKNSILERLKRAM